MAGERVPALSRLFDLAQIPTAFPSESPSGEGPHVPSRVLFGGSSLEERAPFTGCSSNLPSVSSAATPFSSLFSPFAESPMPYSQLLALSTFKVNTPRILPNGKVQTDLDENADSNFLSVNVLLQLEPSLLSFAPPSWDGLDVTLQVIEKMATASNGIATPRTATNDASLPVVHTIQETSLVQVEGTDQLVLQKSMDIPVNPAPVCFASVSTFDVNIVFKEHHSMPEWCMTGSCYIGLQSARKVLYPIRCSFSRALVDCSGTKPTFYCSFALRRQPKEAVPITLEEEGRLDNELEHTLPKRTEIENDFSNDGSSNEDLLTPRDANPPDPSELQASASHGMRPIGPNGRLMTALQRDVFASIRRRFAKTAARDWKRVLRNSDLYPLFTLGRDECAKEMGTCPTWLKVRMRERGVKVWPNRKLIPTTSVLYRLKQQRADIFAETEVSSSPESQEKLQKIDEEITALRDLRMGIVRKSCTPEFYDAFHAAVSPAILDPDWEK